MNAQMEININFELNFHFSIKIGQFGLYINFIKYKLISYDLYRSE